MKYKVLLTASGVGSRLGNFTQYTNKSLVNIGSKPAICHIIERYDKDVEIVVTLGYYGSHVRQFLNLAYPDRNFNFVEVENYDGEGSSLGYSQLSAKEQLQCPFIYNACDTIVTEKIPAPDCNWVGTLLGHGSSQYDSITVDSNKDIRSFHRKGYMDASHVHIGLVGINDYKAYWETLEEIYNSDRLNRSLNDVSVLERLSRESKWKIVEFPKWYDIGNVSALQSARAAWKDKLNVLEKNEESISLVDNKIIKFFYDNSIVEKRVKRAKNLKGLVPDVKNSSDNFYCYDYVKGDLASESITPQKMNDLLDWATKNLWIKLDCQRKFDEDCMYFYYNKTVGRIERFIDGYKPDASHVINGMKVPPAKQLLSRVPWSALTKNKSPSKFHGDFILDNIIIQEEKECSTFKLIDWRHEFGKESLYAGDPYYDLAKLNHNLTVNHDIVCRNLYTVKVDDNIVSCDILRKDNLVRCEQVFKSKVTELGYDVTLVDILTGIIWLNMSPLHHQPFDEFLFYYGKLKLAIALNEWENQ